MDYYDVLGVPKDADEEVIRRAYKKLAKIYHPDANRNGRSKADMEAAEKRFKDIVEAHAVLSDAGKRQKYDEQLRKQSSGINSGMEKGKKTKNSAPWNAYAGGMESFFGFSFTEDKVVPKQGGKSPKNPIDTTKMFEKFMNIK